VRRDDPRTAAVSSLHIAVEKAIVAFLDEQWDPIDRRELRGLVNDLVFEYGRHLVLSEEEQAGRVDAVMANVEAGAYRWFVVDPDTPRGRLRAKH
jgi:hypothetical protein